MAGRLLGHMRWTARYSIRYKKGSGLVTALPYECMLANPTRPGLVNSGNARVYFAHSVVVCGFIAMENVS